MIRGMSYPKGIFYMDDEYIAHGTRDREGNIKVHLHPFDFSGLLFFAKNIILSFPWYFLVGTLGLFIWVFRQPEYPVYLLVLALFGYHFLFPYPLKQFHGAEHKIFSHQGPKTLEALTDISAASIINRHCSTNHVVIFYMLFLLGYFPLGGNGAALLALIGVYVIPRWLRPIDERFFFPISAFLQERWTTARPDNSHVLVGLLCYITLVERREVTEPVLLSEQREERARLKRLELEEQERLVIQERERIIAETEWLEI
jgi:hypothetical protein